MFGTSLSIATLSHDLLFPPLFASLWPPSSLPTSLSAFLSFFKCLSKKQRLLETSIIKYLWMNMQQPTYFLCSSTPPSLSMSPLSSIIIENNDNNIIQRSAKKHFYKHLAFHVFAWLCLLIVCITTHVCMFLKLLTLFSKLTNLLSSNWGSSFIIWADD